MTNIKDLDSNVLQHIVNLIEATNPDLLKTLSNQEADKRRLCQEEQNLTDDIDKATRTLETLKSDLETDIRKATCSLHEHYDPQIDDLKGQIQTLTAKREAIHKEYVSKYQLHASSAPKPVQKPDMRELYSIMVDMLHCNEEYQTFYKRLDNLLTNRCHSTTLFGYDWTIDSLWKVLAKNDHEDLANKILNYYWQHC